MLRNRDCGMAFNNDITLHLALKIYCCCYSWHLRFRFVYIYVHIIFVVRKFPGNLYFWFLMFYIVHFVFLNTIFLFLVFPSCQLFLFYTIKNVDIYSVCVDLFTCLFLNYLILLLLLLLLYMALYRMYESKCKCIVAFIRWPHHVPFLMTSHYQHLIVLLFCTKAVYAAFYITFVAFAVIVCVWALCVCALSLSLSSWRDVSVRSYACAFV